MENTVQDVYIDSPVPQRTSLRCWTQTQQRSTSPTSTSSEAAVKTSQDEPPAYTNSSYLDSPPLSYHDSELANSNTSCSPSQRQPLSFHVSPSTDCQLSITSNRPSCSDDDIDDDEHVPLARLLLCHRDAPPAYSTVVQQSYRETLLQHTPGDPEVVDIDEEAALERIRADDVRFTVERAVAMAVVMALVVLGGVLVGLLFLKN